MDEDETLATSFWKKQIGPLLGVVILVAIVIIVVVSRLTASSGGTFKTIPVPSPSTPYESSADAFSVDFPGSPQTITATTDSAGVGQIPITEYREQYSSNQEYAYYLVLVYHYPAGYDLKSNDLKAALNSFKSIINGSYQGSTISSQHSSTFLGNKALSAVITVPVKLTLSSNTKTNTSADVTVTSKGQDVYVISCYGMPASDYNQFLKSFKFI